MADETQVLRKGREGNRWFNERPDGEALAKWFETAVVLPNDGMKHENYVAGVTLIPGKEKANEPRGFADNGTPLFTEVQNLVFTPYVKVETRVQFFHDLMALNREEWLGVIEPVEPEKPSATLPPGFSRISIANGDRVTNFITCTMKVTVYKRSTVEYVTIVNQRTGEKKRVRTGETIIDPAPATKMVPTLSYNNADVHLLEKAETGAVGRALGMAGMLVVPGTGVATAEDMREVVDNEGVSPEGREERPPREGGAGLDASAEPTHAELVTMAEAAITKLKGLDEPTFTLFLAWCKESGYSGKVSEMKDPDLKVVIRKAEREVEGLEAKAAENG